MKCQKCGDEFVEKEIDESHDIPKYMGGLDSDGRHQLCKECHKEYEKEVLHFACMQLIKNSPETFKSKLRFLVKQISERWFNE